jgi:hypothetical protein
MLTIEESAGRSLVCVKCVRARYDDVTAEQALAIEFPQDIGSDRRYTAELERPIDGCHMSEPIRSRSADAGRHAA